MSRRRQVVRVVCVLACVAGWVAAPSRRAAGEELPGAKAQGAATAVVATGPVAAREWMEEAYRLKGKGDLAGAARAFEAARKAGADSQRIEMELAYLSLARDKPGDAKVHLLLAEQGSDPALTRQAKAQLHELPPRFWGELYGDAIGWYRLYPNHTADLVPTLRLRALWRPWLNLDLHFYLFGQFTRDAASTSASGLGPAVVLADDFVMVGAGALFRFLRGRMGLFAQIGPAFDLLSDGKRPVELDIRGGIYGAFSSAMCFPGRYQPHPVGFCGELYFEGVYVYRYDNNVILFARPRVGFQVLRTGPIAWQPLLEVRLAKDLNDDYWNNFAEVGIVHRWRLLSPVSVDLILGVHAGTYFGLAHTDPAPHPLQYIELRALLSTYLTTDVFRH